MSRPPLHGLYVLADDSLMTPERLLVTLAQVLPLGPALVQFRSKVLPAPTARELARALLRLCQIQQVPLLINDDLELCQQLGAAGVHLGQQDRGIAQARARLGPGALIGASCYDDLAAAEAAVDAGADYVSFGRVFDSRTKPGAPAASLSTIRLAKRRLPVAVCAIGGIEVHNAERVLQQGADLLACAHGVLGQTDPVATAARLVALCVQSKTKEDHV